MMAGRWKVACINWGHPEAPHALAYKLVDGIAVNIRYFATHAQAFAWAEDVASR